MMIAVCRTFPLRAGLGFFCFCCVAEGLEGEEPSETSASGQAGAR